MRSDSSANDKHREIYFRSVCPPLFLRPYRVSRTLRLISVTESIGKNFYDPHTICMKRVVKSQSQREKEEEVHDGRQEAGSIRCPCR
ncbi:hypothetical protein WN55_08827 [Dufourea novaeangliae]|uniref:Uncharacterized protein n=1 Tax=Dufourea novaeangliae TaxID=178035 RepID=A0A154P265_DUFNO|nr:hypothetical protein WN55_08827 [Dufourea novaeangliae]